MCQELLQLGVGLGSRGIVRSVEQLLVLGGGGGLKGCLSVASEDVCNHEQRLVDRVGKRRSVGSE